MADLALLDDGSLLVGDLEMKKILRCDSGSRSCLPFAPFGAFTLAENFKFMVDQERRLLYIADTNNDRLLVQNLADSSCTPAETTAQLSYPNWLARDDGDRLYLCDTNKFRIIPFQLKKATLVEVDKPFGTMPGLPSSPEDLEELARDPERLRAELTNLTDNLGQFLEEGRHAKPFALASGPDGNLWVAQLNTVMSHGGHQGDQSARRAGRRGLPVAGRGSRRSGAARPEFSGGRFRVDPGLYH